MLIYNHPLSAFIRLHARARSRPCKAIMSAYECSLSENDTTATIEFLKREREAIFSRLLLSNEWYLHRFSIRISQREREERFGTCLRCGREGFYRAAVRVHPSRRPYGSENIYINQLLIWITTSHSFEEERKRSPCIQDKPAREWASWNALGRSCMLTHARWFSDEDEEKEIGRKRGT